MVHPHHAQASRARGNASPDGMIRYLVRAGLADQSVIGHPETAVTNLSRSHQVWSVRLPGGRSLVVKRARARPGETTGTLGSEIALYAIAARDPRWREVVPACLWIDQYRQVIILDAIESAGSLRAMSHDHGPVQAHAEMLGRAIGTVHQATDGRLPAGFPVTEPWILKVFEPAGWRPPEIDRVLVYGMERREIAAHFAALRSELQPSCVIHGDLKWDNCLLDGDQVRVIDWETACVGDPLWDVAGAIQEYESFQIVAPLEQIDTDRMAECQRALLGAWRAKRNVPEDTDINERIARLTGARMIQTALEYASVSPDERLPRALVQRGITLLRTPTEAIWIAEAA